MRNFSHYTTVFMENNLFASNPLRTKNTFLCMTSITSHLNQLTHWFPTWGLWYPKGSHDKP